jgi:hypothetical protein
MVAYALFLYLLLELITERDASTLTGLFTLGLIPLWLLQYGLVRFIPGFQLLAPGEKPRGLVMMGIAGTALLTLIVGLLVNSLS